MKTSLRSLVLVTVTFPAAGASAPVALGLPDASRSTMKLRTGVRAGWGNAGAGGGI